MPIRVVPDMSHVLDGGDEEQYPMGSLGPWGAILGGLCGPWHVRGPPLAPIDLIGLLSSKTQNGLDIIALRHLVVAPRPRDGQGELVMWDMFLGMSRHDAQALHET